MVEKPYILYVDDEESNLVAFQSVFRHKYTVITAKSAKEGLYLLRQSPIDLILSDFKMAEVNGVDFLLSVKNEYPDVNAILLTAYQESEIAIRSVNEARVFGYLLKPWKKEELNRLIESALQNRQLVRNNKDLLEKLTHSNNELKKLTKELLQLKLLLQEENTHLRKEIEQEKGIENMVGTGSSMKAVFDMIKQVANYKTTVLIQGETGSGKELVARGTHKQSGRSGPFIKVNCAAIPSNLMESELFGYEKGTFTGGLQNGKLGLLEICNKGTLFLDEIGDLPLDMQAKLLHVVQDGSFLKLGGTKPTTVDVRIIAATNRDLREDVAKKKFREDLFYRLNVFSIIVPPLRQRKEDIPILIDHFIKKFRGNYGLAPITLAEECIESLLNYPWPGNVRELEAMVERSLIVNQSNKELYINPSIEAYCANPSFTGQSTQEKSFDEIQRQVIIEKLESHNWKVSGPGGVAELMKLNASTLRSKMVKLGIRKKR